MQLRFVEHCKMFFYLYTKLNFRKRSNYDPPCGQNAYIPSPAGWQEINGFHHFHSRRANIMDLMNHSVCLGVLHAHSTSCNGTQTKVQRPDKKQSEKKLSKLSRLAHIVREMSV